MKEKGRVAVAATAAVVYYNVLIQDGSSREVHLPGERTVLTVCAIVFSCCEQHIIQNAECVEERTVI